MACDPHSFDQIKLPFIFVPHGAPEPTELLGGCADWIKLPATLKRANRGDRQADGSTGTRTPEQRRPARYQLLN
jgi:hypothetical protein